MTQTQTQTTQTPCTEAACGSVLNRYGYCEDHWREIHARIAVDTYLLQVTV